MQHHRNEIWRCGLCRKKLGVIFGDHVTFYSSSRRQWFRAHLPAMCCCRDPRCRYINEVA